MKMHNFVSDGSGVIEDHRPDGCVATPLPQALASVARLAEGIERGSPSGVGSVPLVNCGKGILRGAVGARCAGTQWFGTSDAKSTGNGGTEMVFLEGNGLARAIEHSTKAIDLFAQGVLSFASGFQFVLHCLSAFLLDVSVPDLPFERREIAATDAVLHQPFETTFDNLRERSELLLDPLGLFNQHSQNAVLGPLRVEKVMAIDIGVRLELAVDATVALLHPSWVPGNVEMEEVPAMGLEIETLTRGIGGDQNPQRVLFFQRKKNTALC
jgi:hypothetical protein